MQNFESYLFELVKKVKFRKVNCQFQTKLVNDIKQIKSFKKTFTSTDKTFNMYNLTKETYSQILNNAVTKTYKNKTHEASDKINKIGKVYAKLKYQIG